MQFWTTDNLPNVASLQCSFPNHVIITRGQNCILSVYIRHSNCCNCPESHYPPQIPLKPFKRFKVQFFSTYFASKQGLPETMFVDVRSRVLFGLCNVRLEKGQQLISPSVAPPSCPVQSVTFATPPFATIQPTLKVKPTLRPRRAIRTGVDRGFFFFEWG